MLKVFSRLLFLSVTFLALICSCSTDTPDNPNGGTDDPDKVLPDPVGTVTLKMRNESNGNTYLDNIYIDKANNFSGASFVDVGPVAGLANVTSIPRVGWSHQISVSPGHGYVAYSGGTFYRLYVTGYTLTTGDLIIGAEVKYQKPFGGVDQAINLPTQALTFDSNGGVQGITFKNESIIPFSITSSAGWCHVRKATTTDYDFLYNAIEIEVDPTSFTDTEEAEVKLTTLSGKISVLKITRSGAQPFINLYSNTLVVPSEDGVTDLSLSTNVSKDQIKIEVSQPWLTASFENDIDRIKALSRSIRYVEGRGASRSYESDYGANAYVVKVGYSGNYNSALRNATVTISSGKIKETCTVEQSAFGISVTSSADAHGQVNCMPGSTSFAIEASMPDTKMVIESDASWCTARFNGRARSSYSSSVEVSYDANKMSAQRTAHINILSPEGDLLLTYTLVQDGAILEIVPKEYTLEPTSTEVEAAGVYSPFSLDELEISASTEWLDACINDKGIILKAPFNPTIYDRSAIVSVSVKGSDVKAEMTVTQKKGYMQIIHDGTTINLTPVGVYYRPKLKTTETVEVVTSFETWTPKSDNPDCLISVNGNKLTYRFSETDVSREMNISFEETPCVFRIKQFPCCIGTIYTLEGELNQGTLLYVDYLTGEGIVGKTGGSYQWSKEEVETGAKDVYDGRKNLAIIKTLPDWETNYPIFAAAEKFNEGTSGWYIPASHEKGVGYRIGNDNLNYWSSTEDDDSYAIRIGYSPRAPKLYYSSLFVVRRIQF